jgi:hypothetical protein
MNYYFRIDVMGLLLRGLKSKGKRELKVESS